MSYLSQSSSNTNRDMKSFSFADAYGLGLIAKNPRNDWSEIVKHMSEHAQQIAFEMINPGSGSRNAKSAAQELLNLAEKLRTNQPVH